METLSKSAAQIRVYDQTNWHAQIVVSTETRYISVRLANGEKRWDIT